MKLEHKSTKELLALHNQIADKPAGPKTFATRVKLITRIEEIAGTKRIDLASYVSSEVTAAADTSPQSNRAAETADVPKTPKRSGMGIGELARVLIMDPTGYPHTLIAAIVNAQIPGATSTAKSVRWYASKMRKEGLTVPPRGAVFPAEMDEKQSTEWLKTARVVDDSGTASAMPSTQT